MAILDLKKSKEKGLDIQICDDRIKWMEEEIIA
jgi:hypothetical protein